MARYTAHYSLRKTPQSQAIPGSNQVKNNAGGFAWAIDDWKRLDRFLVLGTDGGTYYVAEKALTVQNADCVARCLKADGPRTVREIVAISKAGRAPKNAPALFALAMACSPQFSDTLTRTLAVQAIPEVARTGSHLLEFAECVQNFRGWGRALRNSIGRWYWTKPDEALAYQILKYRQRGGWSHRDLLRLSHPMPQTESQGALFKYITGKDMDLNLLPDQISGFEQVQKATGVKEAVRIIRNCRLTWEMVPNHFLNEKSVWEALLPQMPMMAMVRNLGKMTSIGFLAPMTPACGTVCQRLDSDAVAKAKVHPLAVLVAMKTYAQGHGMKGQLNWAPVGAITDSLDAAFYHAFGNVEPTNKRIIIALDVSGSMSWPSSTIAGTPLVAREAAAALCMVTARTEPRANWHLLAFSDRLVELDISSRERLDDVIRKTSSVRAGGTDCALPMLAAKERNVNVDAFLIYTDNETWAGQVHPMQALRSYREAHIKNAKLVVVGMTATEFSIADPNDAGSLDVVGFDTATPNLISDFVKGE